MVVNRNFQVTAAARVSLCYSYMKEKLTEKYKAIKKAFSVVHRKKIYAHIS